MATVNVVTQAGGRPGAKHPRVTISGNAGKIVIPLAITNPEVDLEGLGREWFEIDRPGLRPMVEAGPPRLRRLALESILDDQVDDGYPHSVENQLYAIIGFARGGDPVVVGYSPLEASTRITYTGRWIVADLRIRSLKRQPGTNAIIRARLEFELVEHSPARQVQQVGPPPPSTPAPAPATPGATTAAPAAPTAQRPGTGGRRHTIVRGDTLWHLATHYYGDGNLWGRIATANSIRDPRRLTPGQVVVIP